MNIWKITTILLALIAISLFLFQYTDVFNTDKIKVGGIELDEEDLNLFSQNLNSTSFIVCDLEANQCLSVRKPIKGGETE